MKPEPAQTSLVEAPPAGPTALDAKPLDLVAIARDPNVSVEKLERLMAMQERILARTAEEHFNAAMTDAQMEMRAVAADAYNPQTRSKYASYAALDAQLRPIYTTHGFGVSYDTADPPATDIVRVVAYVTHRAGHARMYRADMPADGKGAKGGDAMTRTHATGAAMSYGMRYLLKMIWNVAVGEDDTDGNAPEEAPPDPPGFGEWFMDLEDVADSGVAKLRAAWNGGKEAYRDQVFKAHRREWESLKKKAARVQS